MITGEVFNFSGSGGMGCMTGSMKTNRLSFSGLYTGIDHVLNVREGAISLITTKLISVVSRRVSSKGAIHLNSFKLFHPSFMKGDTSARTNISTMFYFFQKGLLIGY